MHDAPRRRSLDSLKKEARRWLADLATSDAARQRLYRITPDAPPSPTLRDVQHALALEVGEPGWAALTASLIACGEAADETLAHYHDMARALLEAYTLGTPEAMERHWNLTWHRRAWSAMRTYVQIDLGRVAGPTWKSPSMMHAGSSHANMTLPTGTISHAPSRLPRDQGSSSRSRWVFSVLQPAI